MEASELDVSHTPMDDALRKLLATPPDPRKKPKPKKSERPAK
jgi:hypothetical protein